jgi:hypothetical protein
MKRIALLASGLGLLFLLAGVRPAVAEPPALGFPGYHRWKDNRCAEIFAKLKAQQPLTPGEGDRLESCKHLVGPKYVPLPPSERVTPGNGINESFKKSAAKIPPGKFLPPKPPKRYPHPKILRIPPPPQAI